MLRTDLSVERRKVRYGAEGSKGKERRLLRRRGRYREKVIEEEQREEDCERRGDGKRLEKKEGEKCSNDEPFKPERIDLQGCRW